MKKKDKQDLREKNIGELQTLIKKKREELFESRLDKTQNKLKNTRSLFLIRKEIAFVSTIIAEKGIK